MFRQFILCCIFFIAVNSGHAQSNKAENLIVVVLDGMRWQEIFTGADSVLIHHPVFTKDKEAVIEKFWDADVQQRRKKLFPFLWQTVVEQGQLYGNRNAGNLVNVSNPFQLTYPGFSEMITGFADPAIVSNRSVISKSDNVLEFLNTQKSMEGKVAVFATSDLFPFLLNCQQSKLYINADTDTFSFAGPDFRLLNNMQRLAHKPTTERPDLLTYFSALEYVKTYKPRVLYLALGETDAFAHAGDYEQYLETANAEDRMIVELWRLIQSIPQYRNKTNIIITCDHGRGNKIKEQWTKHGPAINDSGEIWIACMGPGIDAKGEIKTSGQLYQGQLAATMAKLMGYDFKPQTHVALPYIQSISKD